MLVQEQALHRVELFNLAATCKTLRQVLLKLVQKHFQQYFADLSPWLAWLQRLDRSSKEAILQIIEVGTCKTDLRKVHSPFVIGRSPIAAYHIPMQLVSRVHCTFTLVNGTWQLFVNGKNGIYHRVLGESTLLCRGSSITLGSKFTFEIGTTRKFLITFRELEQG